VRNVCLAFGSCQSRPELGTLGGGLATIWSMTTREKVEQLLDRLSEEQLEAEYERLRETVDGPPEMAPLPAGWGETVTGEPMPNVAAAVRRSRALH
jgi:hypothetical protein